MIRFGIIGCGHIAKKHMAAIKAVDQAKLVAVCDNNEQRLAEFVSDEVAGYTDVADLLQQEVDVVCICTPSGLHHKLTLAVAKAQKHVIVEKPMALTLEDADEMIEVCDRNQVKLAVVHPNRFRPAVQLLRERLTGGSFGKIGHANATVRWNRNQAYYDQAAWRGTRLMDGGVLLNQAIHNIDLLLWLLGDVEEIFSYQATRIRQIEAEDTSVSVLRFTSGVLAVLEAAVTVYPKNLEESLSIFGEKGTAIVGGTTANLLKEWQFAELTVEEENQEIAKIEQDPFGIPGHQWIIEDMVRAVEEDRRPIVSGVEGRKALSLVLACELSAQAGRPVRMEK